MLAAMTVLLLSANPDLEAAEKLYDQMQFKAAEARLRVARGQASSDEELARVLYLLARTLASARRTLEVEDVYAELLARVPHAAVPTDVSPTLVEAFNRAKLKLYPRDFIRLLQRDRTVVEVVDPWRRVQTLQLKDWVMSVEGKPTALALEDGRRAALPPEPQGLTSRRVIAYDSDNKWVAELAVALEPKPPPPPPNPAITASVENPPPVSRWPEWSLAALSVLSAAAGAAFAVTAAQDYRAADLHFWGMGTVQLGQRAQQRAIAANVLLGTSLLSAGAAILLWRIRF
jgi:hypothetical protein